MSNARNPKPNVHLDAWQLAALESLLEAHLAHSAPPPIHEGSERALLDTLRQVSFAPPSPVEPGSSRELDAETADAFARVARGGLR